MKVPTAIGTLNIETDWYPLIHFVKQQQMPFPALEDREIIIRVKVVDDFETTRDDPPDAYPRTVHVEWSRWTLWRDRIEGEVSSKAPAPGILVAWLWGGLPIFCAPEGFECLHAAAVDTDEGVVLIVGAHDTGKTTTALDLMAGGAHMFADDRVLVNGEGEVRAWSALLHADGRTAQELTGQIHTLDAFGKVWIAPPSPAVRNQAHLAQVYTTGGSRPLQDDGPGWDSAWVNDYGIGERLLASAQAAPRFQLSGIRVALTNRNPWRGTHAWEGGDMTEVRGWLEGLRANGIEAEFVPYDELDESKYDLIHLWHAQYPWSREVATTTTKPLVISAITQQDPVGVYPSLDLVTPAVERASVVLCYSAIERDWYQERFPQLNGRFRIMPQGVPAALYEDAVEVVEPTGKYVFQAGRYAPVKNQLATFEACQDLNVPVVFAGPLDPTVGPYITELRRAAGTWKGARFFGILKGKLLYDRFRGAHVHCQPSLWETCGVSTLEAAAHGCNLVYTDRGYGPPVYERYASICSPDRDSVRGALERELSLPRNRHGFRPLIWQRAVRVAIPWYREALEMEAAT